MWRLVMEQKITYSEASRMSAEMLLEANAALDIYIDKVNKSNKKK